MGLGVGVGLGGASVEEAVGFARECPRPHSNVASSLKRGVLTQTDRRQSSQTRHDGAYYRTLHLHDSGYGNMATLQATCGIESGTTVTSQRGIGSARRMKVST